ncbi:hypothetical protein GMMP15_1030069 [Candidatus Magnetomoraceae bacterium gMMP-15]
MVIKSNGGHWAKSATVENGEESKIVMRWNYPLQKGFYYPDYDENGEPDAKDGEDVAFLNGGQNHSDPPRDVSYSISWPQDAPVLKIGETLTEAKYGLPDLVNWASGEVIFDENIYKKGGPLAKLFDPYTERQVDLAEVPENIITEKKYGKVWFTDLSYAIRSRLFYDSTFKKLNFIGINIDTGLGDSLLLPNVMSIDEKDRIKALDASWGGTIDSLFKTSRNPNGVSWKEDVQNPYRFTLEGSGLLTLSDNWFMVRYYYGDQPGNKYGVTYPALADPPEAELGEKYWSQWAGAPGNETAQLAEGWIKRVLSDLNPLDARVTDFYNYPAGTMVDVITQLGPKYEGDIALNGTAENLNNLGLIETYQTIRDDSIDYGPDAEIDYGPVNNSILLVSTKLAYFYAVLANEAYEDAQDPTIGFDTKSEELGYMATSLFAFQNQTASLLDEELVLMRGRDNVLGTTRARPVYNRFIWNFTDGEGELAYVQTYNISDENISGVIDEFDAEIMYPQGHGDAWGHYLTAMKTWYELLRHEYFTWEPRAESVMVAGAPVAVDYFDERKFAQTAASKAKIGEDIVDLTYRQNYVAEPSGQWQEYKDTDPERSWGLDGWARRVGQGTYFDWITATAMIPAEDPDPSHTGIQKIDRSSVPELRSISKQNQSLQEKVDQADQRMNPLGLASGVVPFDIDPHIVTADDPDIDQSMTHFEQIYERTKQFLNNAAVTFDYATQQTLRLRGNDDTLTDFNREVEDQEFVISANN